MNTIRFNITLPLEIGTALRGIKNKSAFIADAIKERLEKEQKEQLLKELEEGYIAINQEDKIITQEWDCTTGDGIA